MRELVRARSGFPVLTLVPPLRGAPELPSPGCGPGVSCGCCAQTPTSHPPANPLASPALLAQGDAHLVSSSSSVLWMASVSYLVLQVVTSVLSLDTRCCSSDLPPCSSSSCSFSRSRSCLVLARLTTAVLRDCGDQTNLSGRPQSLWHPGPSLRDT